MASETLQKFAEELRTAREAKGISILQISNRTKIDPKFLSAIENADFEILPDIYVRAFIKELAQTIDLNPTETIQKYELAKTGQPEKTTLATKEQIAPASLTAEAEKANKSVPEEKHGPKKVDIPPVKEFDSTPREQANPQNEIPKNFLQNNLNVIIGVAVLVVAIAVFYFALFYESSPEIVTDQQEQNVSESSERFEVKQADPKTVQDSITLASVVSDSLRLSVQNSEQVWIKVLSDGRIVRQGIVQKNTTMNFKAKKQFGVSIGNAGAVKLFFNEQPVKNVGKPGEIRNITITTDTIRYLTIPRNEKKSPTRN
ncbi:MAG: helix-turn-helix domain-containing protein [Ignavibacteria bacterium]|nr:helix-turn-helix domain-containing protein [Ignavibacteria bacterium]